MPFLVTIGDTEMRKACLGLAVSLGKVAVPDSAVLDTAGRCPELKAWGVKSPQGGHGTLQRRQTAGLS